jgi:hypothetical protein
MYTDLNTLQSLARALPCSGIVRVPRLVRRLPLQLMYRLQLPPQRLHMNSSIQAMHWHITNQSFVPYTRGRFLGTGSNDLL